MGIQCGLQHLRLPVHNMDLTLLHAMLSVLGPPAPVQFLARCTSLHAAQPGVLLLVHGFDAVKRLWAAIKSPAVQGIC
jgi:hypothetical protein